MSTAFVSTTIPYVNARPHLGHAFEYVESDAYARFMAAEGDDVFFLSGSDENSLKNVLAAEAQGITARELVDRNVTYFEQLLDVLGIGIDKFIRTSVDQDHLDGAAAIWRRMDASGDIYAQDYEGKYCVGCEQFYTDDELIDGRCPEHRTVPELVSERNYFFRLSRYADQLLEAIDSGQLRIVPESRRNEVVGFIRTGLTDISISRSIGRARGWGIPVPGSDEQVMYVWIDALANYTNALGWTRDSELYEKYWVGAHRRAHVVGKGVLRFHAVYWPAMLISAGLPMPTEVVVHGYITVNGEKLSKSSGVVVDPVDLVERFGQDALRYYLLAHFSPFTDGDFTEDGLVSRYNTDLANGLGNLVSRVTAMTVRYRDGVVPRIAALDPERHAPELALAEQVARSAEQVREAMARYDHREAVARLWDAVRRANAYIDERAPWHLAKAEDDDSAQLLDVTLNRALHAVRDIAILLTPFLPRAGAAVLEALHEDTPSPVAGSPDLTDRLGGREITKAPPLFPRLEVAAPA